MRPDRYLWITLSVFFCSLGAYVLIDSMRNSGPYAEVWILFGGTLAGLGLAAIFFGFKQRAQISASPAFETGSSLPEGKQVFTGRATVRKLPSHDTRGM